MSWKEYLREGNSINIKNDIIKFLGKTFTKSIMTPKRFSMWVPHGNHVIVKYKKVNPTNSDFQRVSRAVQKKIHDKFLHQDFEITNTDVQIFPVDGGNKEIHVMITYNKK